MPEPTQAETAAEPPLTGTSRRGMLRGAAGLGVAGLAAGALGGVLAAPASAAPVADGSAAHDEPLIIHVNDARTGVIDLYTGTAHVRVTDRQLAAQLARAAR